MQNKIIIMITGINFNCFQVRRQKNDLSYQSVKNIDSYNGSLVFKSAENYLPEENFGELNQFDQKDVPDFGINTTADVYDSFAEYFTRNSRNFKYIKLDSTINDGMDSREINKILPAKLNRNLIVNYSYDFERSLTENALNLQKLLSNLYITYLDDFEIYLIAHGIGGIAGRIYLETSVSDDDPWYRYIKALITLGTPHLGIPLVLKNLLGMKDIQKVGNNLMLHQQYTLVAGQSRNSDVFSTYELLPPPRKQFIFSSNGTSIDIYNTHCYNGISSYLLKESLDKNSLTNAREFFDELENAEQKTLPPYYCISGISALTPTCTGFTLANGDLRPAYSRCGDSLVPGWSALYEGGDVKDTYEVSNVLHFDLPARKEVQEKIFDWMFQQSM